MIELLSSAGATLNGKDNDGDTPAHIAAMVSHPKVLSELHRLGASLSEQNNDGDTPLHLVAVKDQMQFLRMLLQPLSHAASSSSHQEALRILTEAGVDLNKRNEQGYTALHLAVASGNKEAIQTLLAARARRDLKNNNRQTPLDLARLHPESRAPKMQEITRLLTQPSSPRVSKKAEDISGNTSPVSALTGESVGQVRNPQLKQALRRIKAG